MSDWWITTGALPDGAKLFGPYGSFDAAVEARATLEDAAAPDTYSIDSDDPAASVDQ